MGKPILVIVGAGPGVSASVARKFGANGFRVALVARKQSTLDSLTAELGGQGIETLPIAADATRPETIREAFETVRKRFGSPDALLYNAAVISQSTVSTLEEQRLIEEFQVNVVGALTSVKQVIPEFVKRRQGTILVTGGGIAISPNPEYASLSLGKAAVRSLVYSLAEELKPHNVYVGTVSIGGHVAKGTFYDPDRIADKYWDLYQSRDEVEYLFAQP